MDEQMEGQSSGLCVERSFSLTAYRNPRHRGEEQMHYQSATIPPTQVNKSKQDISKNSWNLSSLPYFETLPRKSSTVEIHEDITERLHVISSTLLDALVSVDACIASCTRQVLVVTIGNMLSRVAVGVFLWQAEVNDIDLEKILMQSKQKFTINVISN